MARIFYYTATGDIYGVHPGEFSGDLPAGVSFIDVPEQPHEIVWPAPAGPGNERTAKVSGGALVAKGDIPVPEMISKLQLVRSLRVFGKWASVKGAIAQFDTITKEDWEFAYMINRTDPVVIDFATSLGITAEEMDNIFIAGASL